MSTGKTWGRSPELGPRGTSEGGALPSARFYENQATSGHDPQRVGAGTLTMRWTAAAFDNLGMGSDWDHDGSGTFTFPESGYYLICVYIQMEPDTCSEWDQGNFSVVLEPNWSDDPYDDWWEQVAGHALDPATRLVMSAVHKIDLAAFPGKGFVVDIHSWSVLFGLGSVTRATISITKLRGL